MTAAASTTFPEIWGSVGPLVGVVVGAILGGLTQIVASARQNRAQRRNDLTTFRRDAYLAALDRVEDVNGLAQTFIWSNSGRIEPAEDDHSDYADWMRQRDIDAAEAYKGLVDMLPELARVHGRIRTFGSIPVADTYSLAETALRNYLRTAAEEASQGVWLADSAIAFETELTTARDRYIAAVRADLGVQELFGRDQPAV